ncbi:hypothetical protein ANN_24700 [Periplaneta americana]|uniref:Uncharacterized protein n=1 Tax=Periplaneta americana TaxID=6978 RepID=A0ABQ8RZM2_PERAM|nr:hypothetical protein ANN_24700 [Periplaneta americana]
MWLCYNCEQDYMKYKAGKSMQKEMETLRMDMNMKLDAMAEAINKLKDERPLRATREERPSQPARSSVIKSPAEKLTNEKKTQRSENDKSSEAKGRKAAQPTNSDDNAAEDDPKHTGPETENINIAAEEEEEEQFTEVIYRKRRRQQQQRSHTIGTGDTEDNLIEAGVARAWLYLGRLSQHTTTEKIKSFLSRKGIQQDVVCEELRTMGMNKAFKIGIPMQNLEETEKPEYWPKGILVRRFRFSRRTTGTQYPTTEFDA